MKMKFMKIGRRLSKIIETQEKEIQLKIPKGATIIIIEQQKGGKNNGL